MTGQLMSRVFVLSQNEQHEIKLYINYLLIISAVGITLSAIFLQCLIL